MNGHGRPVRHSLLSKGDAGYREAQCGPGLVPAVPVGVLLPPDGGQFRLDARPPAEAVLPAMPVEDPERVPRRPVGAQGALLGPLVVMVVAVDPSGLAVPVCPMVVVVVVGGTSAGGVPTVVPACVPVVVVRVPVVDWVPVVPAVVLPPVCEPPPVVPVVWAGAADARARIAATAMDLTIMLVSIQWRTLRGLSARAPGC